MNEYGWVMTRQPEDETEQRHGDELAADFALRFEDALEHGDALEAESIALEALDANLEVEEIYDHVIAPGMIRMGHLWQSGEASVADEHLATAISQQVMSSLFPRMLQRTRRDGRRIMLAGAMGEEHVLGLRMIADTLEGAGFEVIFLGPNVPVDALIEACDKHKPAALGLTAAMSSSIPALARSIEAVLALDEPPVVFVGGRAVEQARDLGMDIPVANTCEEIAEFVDSVLADPVLPKESRELLETGYDEWQEKSPDLIRHEAEAQPESDPDTGELGMASAFSNSALVAAENAREAARDAFRMKELAYRDGLTGLWNRRAYDDRLQELTEEDSTGGAVLMLDIDRFKEINDSYGHEIGDQALIAVGKAILRSIRPSDFGARYGGDEFVVLMPGMSLEGATEVAERIRSTIKKEQRDPPVTVSIGASTLDDDPRASSLAIDQALYGAKRAGRDRVVAT